ncbi:MAG: MFS transporter, partial [Rhodothermales bacterium]
MPLTRRTEIRPSSSRLLLLFFTLFIAMIGFGITLPVLPFFVERLAIGEAAGEATVAFHVGALTSAYALTQLVAAPLWGLWSDRHGRKPLIVIGLGGFAAAQAAFGLGSSLPLLYAARLVAGIFSGALLTGSSAYVADTLPESTRGRGMAWMGTALSLGFFVGPVLSGLLARRDWHVRVTAEHLIFDGFSIPFFAAAGLALATLPFVFAALPESLGVAGRTDKVHDRVRWTGLGRRLKDLLALVFFSQAALALFEAVFALYADRVLRFRLAEIGYAFAVCGLVMALFQGGTVGFLAGRVHSRQQITAGFGLFGMGIGLLLWVRSVAAVLVVVGLLALGVALVTPNLLTLVANRSGRSVGAALGLQNTFSSVGQIAGPLAGGLLFGLQVDLPFQVTAGGALVLATGLWWLGRGASDEEAGT